MKMEASRDTTVNEIKGFKKFGVILLSTTIKLWQRTLRFDFDKDDLQYFHHEPKPISFVLWHDNIFVSNYIQKAIRPQRSIHALISASKDGAWLAAFFKRLGLNPVRGSSSRRTLSATREMIKAIHEGNDIAITPDGPRGPRHKVKEGTAMIAMQANSPIVLTAIYYSKRRQLNSWDKFNLPLPFSKVTVRFKIYPNYKDLSSSAKDRKELANAMEEELNTLQKKPRP